MFICEVSRTNERTFSSPDGKAALWAGVIDDLWKLGKPRGEGGPGKDTAVKAGQTSDPYLMTGYDNKSVRIRADKKTDISLEIDIDGTGLWVPYRTFYVKPGKTLTHTFDPGFSAYRIRANSSEDATATAWFIYR